MAMSPLCPGVLVWISIIRTRSLGCSLIMRFRSVANSWPNLLGRGPILRHFVFLSLIGVVLAGCHKKPAGGSASSPVSEGAAGDPAATPAPKLPPAPPSVTANAENNVQQKVEGEVDPFLTGQLRAF